MMSVPLLKGRIEVVQNTSIVRGSGGEGLVKFLKHDRIFNRLGRQSVEATVLDKRSVRNESVQSHEESPVVQPMPSFLYIFLKCLHTRATCLVERFKCLDDCLLVWQAWGDVDVAGTWLYWSSRFWNVRILIFVVGEKCDTANIICCLLLQ